MILQAVQYHKDWSESITTIEEAANEAMNLLSMLLSPSVKSKERS